ncbi:MAG: HD domain-containing protein [Candidatus Omnitrophica bacterium]|nr:HD domain-containing protein [Candidatus Omnitrophota bacterium]
MRTGVIDIGSSSIKLIIGEVHDEKMVVLEFLKNIVPIGQDTFYKGGISQASVKQIISIIDKYKNVMKEYEVSNVKIIATTAVREARNREIFVDTISRKTGFPIEVLAVGDIVYYIDAYLSYALENKYPIHTKNVLIAELGAGSLDISIMEKGFTLLNIGLPIGTFRIRQIFSKLDGSIEESQQAIKEYIENEFAYLKRIFPTEHIDDVIILDESYFANLAHLLAKNSTDSHFSQVKLEDIQTVISELSDKSSEEIARICKVSPEIADTVFAYIMILNGFSSLVKNKSIYVLGISLAEAVLANILLGFKLDKKYNKTNQLSSIARFLCHKYNVDFIHAQHVVDLSVCLFNGLKEILGVNDGDLLYLILAAYLHDIGGFIHNRSHHKHSEYVINCLNLFRLTEEEMRVIACIARYHRKTTPRKTHIFYNSLSSGKQILVQKLSALLRIANALDSSHRQKVNKLKVQIGRKQDIGLIINTREKFLLEKVGVLEEKEFFEEITGSKINIIIRE